MTVGLGMPINSKHCTTDFLSANVYTNTGKKAEKKRENDEWITYLSILNVCKLLCTISSACENPVRNKKCTQREIAGKLRHSCIAWCILSIYGSEINKEKRLGLLILTVNCKLNSTQNECEGFRRFCSEHFKTLWIISEL